jgi:hypothetical protein
MYTDSLKPLIDNSYFANITMASPTSQRQMMGGNGYTNEKLHILGGDSGHVLWNRYIHESACDRVHQTER